MDITYQLMASKLDGSRDSDNSERRDTMREVPRSMLDVNYENQVAIGSEPDFSDTSRGLIQRDRVSSKVY